MKRVDRWLGVLLLVLVGACSSSGSSGDGSTSSSSSSSSSGGGSSGGGSSSRVSSSRGGGGSGHFPDADEVTSGELTNLRSTGDVHDLAPGRATSQGTARATQDAANRAILDTFVTSNPAQGSRINRPLGMDVSVLEDGTIEAEAADLNGNMFVVLLDGPSARDATLAAGIQAAQSRDNEALKYATFYARLPEACVSQFAAPQDTAALTLAQLSAQLAAMATCIETELANAGPPPDGAVPGRPDAPGDYEGNVSLLSGGYGGDEAGVCGHLLGGFFYKVTWPGKAFDTPVKNQGRRGSCVSFAIVGAMERGLSKAGRWTNLSEQSLYAAAKLVWDPLEVGDGLNTVNTATVMAAQNYAVPLENVWPYNTSRYRVSCQGNTCDNNTVTDPDHYIRSCGNADGTDVYAGPACSNTTHQGKRVCQGLDCYYWTPKSPTNFGFTVSTAFPILDAQFDATMVRTALSLGMPVVASVDVTRDFMLVGPQGIFRFGTASDYVKGSHAVQLSGWVPNNKLAPGIPLGPGGGYYVVKNSWSCDWGDGGYIYVGKDWLEEHLTSAVLVVPSMQGPNVKPTIQINTPANDAHLPYAGLGGGVHLTATVSDQEEGANCCTVQWRVDDEVIGAGRVFDWYPPAPGEHTIRLNVWDSEGGYSTTTVHVFLDNAPPTAQIIQPVADQTVYVNTNFILQGTATDMNEPLGIPCERLRWTASPLPRGGNDPFPQFGCQFPVKFSSVGNKTITLRATDSAGALSAPVSVLVHVVTPPLNAPPSVTILAPGNNSALFPQVEIQLVGEVTEPDVADTVTYRWTAKELGSTTETDLGTTETINWTPGTTFPFHCGGVNATLTLYATDKDGTTSDSVDVWIEYPTC